eukprot:scaffold2324_cov266-Pinguiococcus_pyrenoidosus.AAC.4
MVENGDQRRFVAASRMAKSAARLTLCTSLPILQRMDSSEQHPRIHSSGRGAPRHSAEEREARHCEVRAHGHAGAHRYLLRGRAQEVVAAWAASAAVAKRSTAPTGSK